uniref:Uncharacterized protein n=1 Tax=Panagrolaimus sp. ES5 TaxID=591445 RepID=A0AC34G1S7_9BILA
RLMELIKCAKKMYNKKEVENGFSISLFQRG